MHKIYCCIGTNERATRKWVCMCILVRVKCTIKWDSMRNTLTRRLNKRSAENVVKSSVRFHHGNTAKANSRKRHVTRFVIESLTLLSILHAIHFCPFANKLTIAFVPYSVLYDLMWLRWRCSRCGYHKKQRGKTEREMETNLFFVLGLPLPRIWYKNFQSSSKSGCQGKLLMGIALHIFGWSYLNFNLSRLDIECFRSLLNMCAFFFKFYFTPIVVVRIQ